MLEGTALKLGQQVITHVTKAWLNHRKAVQSGDLVDLLAVSVTDQLFRRRLARQLEEIGDQVATRVAPLLESGLAEHERTAALDAVVDTLTEADLSDAALFATDLDPIRLARQVRDQVPAAEFRAGLSEPAAKLYQLVLDETCVCLATIVRNLPEFTNRAQTELLSRMSGIPEILDRLPRTTLDAPRGTDHDTEFAGRYRRFIAERLDRLELFGVDVRRYTARTSVGTAYLSLTVTGAAQPVDPLGAVDEETSSRRIEQALANRGRVLLRGEAGSGKSTLLQWVAVNAARSTFTGPLQAWNGRVPFFVRLRSHAEGPLPKPSEMVGTVAEFMPEGWAHRRFADGSALLLVDGVDELKASRRRTVHRWLGDLLSTYPDIIVIVTSRPGAAEPRWLDALGFHALLLEPMTGPDIEAFCRRWHEAIRESVRNGAQLHCEIDELAEYEASIIRQFETKQHLRALAASPLLCAMLCALNLDRRKQLPPDRMKLYEAAIELLIERRDAERDLCFSDLALDSRTKLALLQYLAWWLTMRARAELTVQDAVHRVGHFLERMPHVSGDPQEIVDHLLERSGIIRRPSEQRIDFIHRTFQEYLAGKYFVSEHLIEVLVLNAHKDQWRETILLAAGHCTDRLRADLVIGLLDRADQEPRHRRRLRLLAVAAIDSGQVLSPEVSRRAGQALAELLPPRNAREVPALATAGEAVVDLLPDDPSTLTTSAAEATVWLLSLVNGDRALRKLIGYAQDPRLGKALLHGWEFWEPRRYVEQVLSQVRSWPRFPRLSRPEHVPYLSLLRDPPPATVQTLRAGPLRDLSFVAGQTNFRVLTVELDPRYEADLAVLTDNERLEMLLLHGSESCRGHQHLAGLPALKDLRMHQARGHHDLRWLPGLERLESLDVRGCRELTALDGLADFTELTQLELWNCPNLTDFGPLSAHPGITDLSLDRPAAEFQIRDLGSLLDRVTMLNLHNLPNTFDLADVADSPLRHLWLTRCAVSSLSALQGMKSLTNVSLTSTELAGIEPLVGLPNLSRLDLRGATPGLDLTPLKEHGRPISVWLEPNQQVRGLENLGSEVSFDRRNYAPG
ncbi:NACHT domain-containing protein [Pseudonocardiaceae bacterium YIM PH 21723]|nr:NACHT domain-containing protein [Pseudonocardiaceae bacterium YIM PH 21723]